MKNWHTLTPDTTKLLTRNFTPGRGGHKIDMVVIHHNAGNLTVEDCYNVWQTRPASAHYQVESGGRIGQLVYDRDTAHHAGNWNINQRSIGIEVANNGGAASGWPISPTAVREAGRLIAAICKYYKLGAPKAGVNVRFHREFSATFCPGELAPGGRYNAMLMDEATRFYKTLTSTKETNKVDYQKLIFQQLAGYKKHSKLLFPGWAQLGGRTLVDAVAAIGSALDIPGFFDPKKKR